MQSITLPFVYNIACIYLLFDDFCQLRYDDMKNIFEVDRNRNEIDPTKGPEIDGFSSEIYGIMFVEKSILKIIDLKKVL